MDRTPADSERAGHRTRLRIGGDPVSWLAALIAVFALVGLLPDRPEWAGVDYYQFWLAGRAGGSGEPVDVWSDAVRVELGEKGVAEATRAQPRTEPARRYLLIARYRSPLETYATPWLYTVFGATASGDYERDMARFQVVSLVALVLGMLAFARLRRALVDRVLLLFTLAAAWFAPTISDFRVGNVNRVQLGLLALSLGLSAWGRLPARNVWGGVVLGLAVAFKPNLAFPALTLGLGWMALGRWRKLGAQVAGALAGAAVAVVLSSLWFGSAGAWSWWLGEVGKLLAEYDHSVALGNVALMRVLVDTTGFSSTATLLVLFSALFAAGLWIRRRAAAGPGLGPRDEAIEDVTLGALGLGLSLLTTQLAWLHYEVLALPLGVLVLRPGARPAVRLAGALALLAVALEPVRDVLGFAENELPSAVCVALGTLALFALGLLELGRPRPEPS